MYKFIKDLLKKKEPEKLFLTLDAVPALLDEREKTLRLFLETDTGLPIQNIRNASAQLQHIVNGIAGAEHDPAIHPKLKSIAKNSLPLFVKAMNASLKKDLPEDIEEHTGTGTLPPGSVSRRDEGSEDRHRYYRA
jgi:hypothetical protein